MSEERLNLALILTIVLAVLISGAFGYYYYTSSKTITERNATIATMQTQVSQLSSQVSTQNSQITKLQSDLTAANASVSSLQTQLTSASTKESSTESSLAAANASISSLQSQLTTANGQVTTLQSQVTDLQNVNNLSQSTIEASSYTVSQSAGSETVVSSFTATYPGYILVTGSSTSSTGYIRVVDSYSSYYPSSTRYTFGTGTNLIIPVLPGTVYVYFGNEDASGTPTGYISATYYY